jgi:integrase
MGREHLVPLATQTVALLKEIREHSRGEYLFPGPRRPLMNTNTQIFALYDLGYRNRQTVHGFRGLFSTVLNESGRFQGDWIEMQLAHSEKNEIRGSYNAAEYLDQRVGMMQWWADFLYPPSDFDELLGAQVRN